jgi:hypothetical protein
VAEAAASAVGPALAAASAVGAALAAASAVGAALSAPASAVAVVVDSVVDSEMGSAARTPPMVDEATGVSVG